MLSAKLGGRDANFLPATEQARQALCVLARLADEDWKPRVRGRRRCARRPGGVVFGQHVGQGIRIELVDAAGMERPDELVTARDARGVVEEHRPAELSQPIPQPDGGPQAVSSEPLQIREDVGSGRERSRTDRLVVG